ncbi:MAG TPA: PrsW family glutamic-type intramembrane protease [Thermoplasmata archaeon]|nr:PrsW family glutamic-type intramembrane protease [Thermoplasmata archaeon]
MIDFGALPDLLILVLAALLPALVYLAWVRKGERYQTEPWGPLLSLFFYGAIVATIISAILELLLVALGTAVSQSFPAPEFTFLNGNSSAGAFFLVLVIAPFVEEALKASGVTRAAARIRILGDGPVFGASVGLGFGFFETLIYGVGAFVTGGLVAGLGLIFIRSLSSVLLHGSTTAMFGYGFARQRFSGGGGAAGAYYVLAVVMHSSFNALASLSAILLAVHVTVISSDIASLIGLLVAITFAFGALEHARTLASRSTFPGASGPHPRFRPPPPVRVRSQGPPGAR